MAKKLLSWLSHDFIGLLALQNALFQDQFEFGQKILEILAKWSIRDVVNRPVHLKSKCQTKSLFMFQKDST